MKFEDFPLEEIARAAKDTVDAGGTVFQKWTCQHCGSRQTMEEKNQFYRSGLCENCGGTSIISRCNYIAIFHNTGAKK